MAHTRDITVIGGSAGGMTAVREILRALPADYPAAVFVVLHVAPESPPVLADILNRISALPVRTAGLRERIRAGTVLVPPPDHHLVLEHDVVRISHGPRENRHRPSIDVLFRSAAVAFGTRVTGVVLSGMLDDGSAGLWAIKRRGGVAVVQDPATAEYPDMPRNALETARADYCLPAGEIATRLVMLAREAVADPVDIVPRTMAREVLMASDDLVSMEELDSLGKRVPFTCPECGGSLWELDDAGTQHFRCHVGHAYSIQTLVAEQSARVEAALWAALRSLEENERLARRMSVEAGRRGNDRSASSYTENAQTSASHAEVLRDLLAQAGGPAMQAEGPGGIESRK
ncbi:MAG: chemotaxis protein CheB [Burkholderiales bacterium]|nr:chemotaxis protein CheB [Burkholderiales bacterium]